MDLFARFVASFFQVGDALELGTTTDADVVCWCQNVRVGFDGLSRYQDPKHFQTQLAGALWIRFCCFVPGWVPRFASLTQPDPRSDAFWLLAQLVGIRQKGNV